ncbi:peptidase E [Gammaproteobacteria bacterium]|jgi:dipeptidase E|nr:peptidase E [Gammaproteobacteria bacterium]MDA7828411.1 peptidase E [Gammaproteobacteria bacterium]MDC1123989.1 peptidase E [Gammaproteobacteria bacterium]
MKQIISIGGGGFGRSLGELRIEKYIINQSKSKNPKICFIPTATGDDNGYINNFYRAFNSLACIPSDISFFKRTIDLRKHILDQDIIFVGGGNTKSMLAVWREWGLDVILKEAYDKGVIMSGVSAGAICWFEQGITDSWSHDLAIMDCLGFVNGTCCPHYDEEPNRRPFVSRALKNKSIDSCISIEGFNALHLVDDSPKYSVAFKDNNDTYNVVLKNGEVSEDQIDRVEKIKV